MNGIWGIYLLSWLILLLLGYFLGCLNGSVMISHFVIRDDVRQHGSGNAGLTNFYRTFGGPLTFVVILTDVLKAVVAILVGASLFSGIAVDVAWVPYFTILGKYWSALFCLLGHMFPCMFHFKGGKGILSGGTIALMMDWRIALVVWGGFLILAIVTRYVSLGSVWAGASFPFISWYCYPYFSIVVLAFIIGGLVVWQHRGNIRRLLHGNENKFSLHPKREGKT